MSPTWHGDRPPAAPEKLTVFGWARVLLRGLPLAILVFGGLALTLLLRLIERPLFGQRRPWTPFITCFVCRGAFFLLGMGFHSQGTPMRGAGAVVANHSSWLDIFALNARKRIYFVSKEDVAAWPGIGWLARATGTVFISRQARAAGDQARLFETRLRAGHRLLFFPEGTSSDSRRVLPFKSSLFAAFFTQDLRQNLSVQPVSVVYIAPKGEDPRYYGWWGDMEFGPHLLMVLGAKRQGAVRLIYHPPFKVAEFIDRKALARACEALVRAGLDQGLGLAQQG
ncbi:MAG: 1-acyl-sn-glycerol-3-phosphate acyltransferase [Mangrovicoccus sp.]|nr:1-acyl-sn-glycerol-3-phosphate acyltransferase [Mangrovicoccus sp.]